MGQANHLSDFTDLPHRMRLALGSLLEASKYADQTGCDCWEFAVELDGLVKLDLSLNDFRWLVRNALVEHRREVTLESDDGRAFRPSGDLTFPDRTCFVLTVKGIALARQVCGSVAPSVAQPSGVDFERSNGPARESNGAPHSIRQSSSGQLRPCWDPDRRLLRFNGVLVKHFKWSAENQEAILSAFEEEGWPSRIDDPLPPHEEQDSKRRLSDTIKCLNRKQDNSIIHFRGDGTGEGVVWEFIEDRVSRGA